MRAQAGLQPLVRREARGGKPSVAPGVRPPAGARLALVLDFDCTLTQKDTVESAVNAATACIASAHGREAASQHSELVQSLVQEYEAEASPVIGRTAVPDTLFRDGALAAADAIDNFEQRMYPLLARALSGVTRQALADVGSSVPLAHGALRLLAAARASPCTVRVASSNPSSTLIQAALARERDLGVLEQLRQDRRFMPEVLASEPDFSGPNNEAIEGFSRIACTGYDKVEHGFQDADYVAYVGDSLGDLQPMLYANTPIAIGAHSKLHDALERLEVDAYTADSLDDVLQAFFLSPSSSPSDAATEAPSTGGNGGTSLTEQQTSDAEPTLQLPKASSVPVVLSIAGSDSGGGAGIQADIKAGTECGAHVASAVTAITTQDTRGVHGVHNIPCEDVESQLHHVLEDLKPDTLKTGMVPSGEVAHIVARKMMELRPECCLVVDPVLVAATGDTLVPQAEVAKITLALFPLATCATPNGAEANVLLRGIAEQSEGEEAGTSGEAGSEGFVSGSHVYRGVTEKTARSLLKLGPRSVVLKGGNAPPADNGSSAAPVIDYLALDSSALALGTLIGPRNEEETIAASVSDTDAEPKEGVVVHQLKGRRVDASNAHGTGCALASSISSFLASGFPLHHSVRFAKRYVQGALEASAGANVGQGGSKPMNFAYSRFDWQSKADLKRLDDLRLCAITDESLDRKHGRSVRESVAAAIKGGATVVQVRWKSGETVDCVAAVNQALEAARGSGVPIVVNDRVDVALTCQADGVHVGQKDVVASDVRRLIGPSMLLGVSAKTEEQIATAGRAGADYVGCGAVFGSPTKPESGKLGTDGLHKLASVSPIPVMGIGGVDASNVGQMVTEAGVDSAAVISGIFDTPAPASAAHSVRTALESAINGSTDEVEA